MPYAPFFSARHTRIAGSITLLLLAVAGSACEDPDRCKVKPDCAKLGKCTPSEQGACVVASSQDCKSSELCSVSGQCSAKDGACVAAGDGDCQSSQACKRQGNCSAYQGSCQNPAKTVHGECTKSCASEGACVLQAGKCVALSRLHCAGTFDETPEPESPCGAEGLCSAESGSCKATGDADCVRSAVCKDQGRCHAEGGHCVATEADCQKSAQCSKDGKCGVLAGACAATKSSDCRQSMRCPLEGTCTAKDGRCLALSAADCQRSSNCKSVNHCTPENGACVSSGQRSQAGGGSEPPDKVGSTTLNGLFGN